MIEEGGKGQVDECKCGSACLGFVLMGDGGTHRVKPSTSSKRCVLRRDKRLPCELYQVTPSSSSVLSALADSMSPESLAENALSPHLALLLTPNARH